MIVQDDESKALYRWMCARMSVPAESDLRVIGLQRKDLSIAGAVGYTSWQEDSVFMHVVFESHAVSRDMLREAFMYPFVTCQKKRVYGMTPITAERALRFSKKLGFRELIRTPDFVLQVMTREDCRWVDGKQSSRAKSDPAAGADYALPGNNCSYAPGNGRVH